MNQIEEIIQWVTGLVNEETLYVGVFLASLIETVFPPIPTLAVFPLAGFVAAQSGMGLLETILLGGNWWDWCINWFYNHICCILWQLISFMPDFASIITCHSSIGFPPTETNAFGIQSVIGRSLVPLPPAKISMHKSIRIILTIQLFVNILHVGEYGCSKIVPCQNDADAPNTRSNKRIKHEF